MTDDMTIRTRQTPPDPPIDSESIPLPWYASLVMGIKERAFASAERGWMPPIVMVERNAGPAVIAVPNRGDKDDALRAAHSLWRNFACDAIILAVDTFGKLLPDQESTLPPGELQARVEAGRQDQEGITEAVVCFRVDANTQRVRSTMLPLHADGPGSRLIWLKAQFEDHDNSEAVGGYLVENLQRIVAEPKLDMYSEVAKLDPRLGRVVSHERAKQMQEKCTIEVLREKGFAVEQA